jgi:hypothetical protein
MLELLLREVEDIFSANVDEAGKRESKSVFSSEKLPKLKGVVSKSKS